jgi:hypothetical protein
VRTGALITGACVVGGFAIAISALPPPQAPGRVAESFIQSVYFENWPAAWDALCRAGRGIHGTYTSFTETRADSIEYHMTPSDVHVEIEDTEVVREPGTRGFSVSFRVTADRRNGEDWDARGAALVIREDGDLRVCGIDRSVR